jgi:hypothetical protein
MAQTFDKYALWLAGALIAENISLEMSLDGDDQDVFTLTGYGQQKNKNKVMVNLDNAIPSAGESFNAWRYALTGAKVELRAINLGTGKTLTTEGFIRKPQISSGEGKTSAQKYEFHGDPADWV